MRLNLVLGLTSILCLGCGDVVDLTGESQAGGPANLGGAGFGAGSNDGSGGKGEAGGGPSGGNAGGSGATIPPAGPASVIPTIGASNVVTDDERVVWVVDGDIYRAPLANLEDYASPFSVDGSVPPHGLQLDQNHLFIAQALSGDDQWYSTLLVTQADGSPGTGITLALDGIISSILVHGEYIYYARQGTSDDGSRVERVAWSPTYPPTLGSPELIQKLDGFHFYTGTNMFFDSGHIYAAPSHQNDVVALIKFAPEPSGSFDYDHLGDVTYGTTSLFTTGTTFYVTGNALQAISNTDALSALADNSVEFVALDTILPSPSYAAELRDNILLTNSLQNGFEAQVYDATNGTLVQTLVTESPIIEPEDAAISSEYFFVTDSTQGLLVFAR